MFNSYFCLLFVQLINNIIYKRYLNAKYIIKIYLIVYDFFFFFICENNQFGIIINITIECMKLKYSILLFSFCWKVF